MCIRDRGTRHGGTLRPAGTGGEAPGPADLRRPAALQEPPAHRGHVDEADQPAVVEHGQVGERQLQHPLGGLGHRRTRLDDGRDLNETRINQLHLSRPVVVQPGTSVAEAAERMLELSLTHLPVLDDGRLVGLIDMAAVCRGLLQTGRSA